MFKKIIIPSLAFTGFAMVARDLVAKIAINRSSKSEIARAYVVGTLITKYAEVDLLESKLDDVEIGYAKDMYIISKDLR